MVVLETHFSWDPASARLQPSAGKLELLSGSRGRYDTVADRPLARGIPSPFHYTLG